jgi:hypothetical protein
MSHVLEVGRRLVEGKPTAEMPMKSIFIDVVGNVGIYI